MCLLVNKPLDDAKLKSDVGSGNMNLHWDQRLIAPVGGPSQVNSAANSDETIYLDLLLLAIVESWLKKRCLWLFKIRQLVRFKHYGSILISRFIFSNDRSNERMMINESEDSDEFAEASIRDQQDRQVIVDYSLASPRVMTLRSSRIRLRREHQQRLQIVFILIAIKIIICLLLYRISVLDDGNQSSTSNAFNSIILMGSLLASFIIMYQYYEQYYTRFSPKWLIQLSRASGRESPANT